MLVIKENITERNKNFEKEWNTYQRKKRNIRVFLFMLLGSFFANVIFTIIYAGLGNETWVNRYIWVLMIEVFVIILVCGLKDIFVKCPFPSNILILQSILAISKCEPHIWYDIDHDKSFIYTAFYDAKLDKMDLYSVPVLISNKVSESEASVAYLAEDNMTIMVDLRKEVYDVITSKKNAVKKFAT